MDIMNIIKTRYAAKKFDSTKKISQENIDKLLEILRYSPSSVNSQPWHFIAAVSDEGKKKISKSTQGPFAANEEKVLNAGIVIVFCVKTSIDEIYLNHILEQEEKDGRFIDEKSKESGDNIRRYFVNYHKNERDDLKSWMEKQVYLNLGSFLTGAASLGLDTVAMEGFNAEILDKELGLKYKGYQSLVIAAAGFKSENDPNAKLPKSRLNKNEVFTII